MKVSFGPSLMSFWELGKKPRGEKGGRGKGEGGSKSCQLEDKRINLPKTFLWQRTGLTYYGSSLKWKWVYSTTRLLFQQAVRVTGRKRKANFRRKWEKGGVGKKKKKGGEGKETNQQGNNKSRRLPNTQQKMWRFGPLSVIYVCLLIASNPRRHRSSLGMIERKSPGGGPSSFVVKVIRVIP